jgi:hypothetical protein
MMVDKLRTGWLQVLRISPLSTAGGAVWFRIVDYTHNFYTSIFIYSHKSPQYRQVVEYLYRLVLFTHSTRPINNYKLNEELVI